MGGIKKPHGQDWRLVNIDKVEHLGEWGQLRGFLWYPDSEVLDCLSTAVNLYEWPKLMSQDKRSPAVQTSILLTKLPVELLQAIAKSLMDDFVDLMSFSLTCVTMWNVAEAIRFLYLRIKLQRRSWNGNRIILLGNAARDLPQGLLTEEDRKKFKEMAEIRKSQSYDEEWSDEYSDYGSDDSDNDNNNHSLRYLLYRALRAKVEEDDLYHGDWIHRLAYSIPEASAWCYPDISRFTLRQAPSTSEAEDRWILRNLTKKEFVIKSKGSSSRGLDQALFSLICWSESDFIVMRCDDADIQRMIRGPWAGDRIDVTLYSLHEHKDNPDWKDITKEVLVFLERLAKSDGYQQTFLEDVLPSF